MLSRVGPSPGTVGSEKSLPSVHLARERDGVKYRNDKSKFYKNDPSPINSFLPGSLRRKKKNHC